MQERRPDAEFLYTLKLCYESGLNRTISYVEQLQKKIFGSAPGIEPIRKIGSWIYLSWQYYAMYDISREAIGFNDYDLLKIMNYLTNDFCMLHQSRIVRFIHLESSLAKTLNMCLGRNLRHSYHIIFMAI